jgi:hypothetical protein
MANAVPEHSGGIAGGAAGGTVLTSRQAAAASVPSVPTAPAVPAHHRRGLSLSARLPPWASKVRAMLAPTLVALLAFVFVAVDNLNSIAGE